MLIPALPSMPSPEPSRPSATTSATCPGPAGEVDHREALRFALARIEAQVSRRAEVCARVAARLSPAAAPEVC
jgi:hypothetical protein